MSFWVLEPDSDDYHTVICISLAFLHFGESAFDQAPIVAAVICSASAELEPQVRDGSANLQSLQLHAKFDTLFPQSLNKNLFSTGFAGLKLARRVHTASAHRLIPGAHASSRCVLRVPLVRAILHGCSCVCVWP